MNKDRIETGFSQFRRDFICELNPRDNAHTAWHAAIEWYESQIPEGCTPADAKILRAANHRHVEVIEKLQSLCAAAYQMAGIVGAPLRFLDALLQASNGDFDKIGDSLNLLPVEIKEFDWDALREHPVAVQLIAQKKPQEPCTIPCTFHSCSAPAVCAFMGKCQMR